VATGSALRASDHQVRRYASLFLVRLTAARSDSMRPAIERICAGVAFPVRRALPAMLASASVGGFSGVVFIAMAESSSRAGTFDDQTLPRGKGGGAE
jgi:hypothetical protein